MLVLAEPQASRTTCLILFAPLGKSRAVAAWRHVPFFIIDRTIERRLATARTLDRLASPTLEGSKS